MLIMMLSVHVPSQSFAKGGLIKSIKFFKGGGDDLIKTEMMLLKESKLKRKFLMELKAERLVKLFQHHQQRQE